MRHTISIIVANEAGELSRIVGLFSARGYNIETISVGKTLDPRWSKATVVTQGDGTTIEQIVKQCARLARVKEVRAVTTLPHIEREMALIDGSPRSATARAKTDCQVAPISENAFQKLLVETPLFALSVMRTLADRLGCDGRLVGAVR